MTSLDDPLLSDLDALTAPGAVDAIVVGCGAAGGMAAMRLTEAGLRVLALDAGFSVPFWRAPYRRSCAFIARNLARPELMNVLPMRAINAGKKGLKLMGRVRQPVQSRCFAWEMDPAKLVDDRENPYLCADGAPFQWFRSRQLGGRMIVPGHGRMYFRLTAKDFAPEDGLSPAWPFAPDALDPWYAFAERRLGLTGLDDGHDDAPSSEIAHRLEPVAAELETQAALRERWPGLRPIMGRSAPPPDFLERAAATGRLMVRQGAAALKVTTDAGGRAEGVVWRDMQTRSLRQACAPLVFVCASTLESTRLLLNSRTARSPAGLGGGSGALGRHLMDHVVLSADGVGGGLPGEPVVSPPGRCVYAPAFHRRGGGAQGRRGYGVQLYRSSIGKGRSFATFVTFAEMLPRAENRVTLDETRTDAFGAPLLRIDCRYGAEELAMAGDQREALGELCELFKLKINRLDLQPAPPGSAIHECGSARMGADPASSVLDPYGQVWDAPGVYVTDGASFVSQGAQNPTLTILALTARACGQALGESAPPAA